MAYQSDAFHWTVSSTCPNCSHPIRGHAAHASHAFMSHTLYLERSFHRYLRPHANFSNLIGGYGETISMHGGSFDSYMLLTPSQEPSSELEGIAGSDNTTPSYLAHPQRDESNPQGFNTTARNSSVNSIQFFPVATPLAQPIDVGFHNTGPECAEIGAIFSGNNDILPFEDDLSYVSTISSGSMSFVAGSGPFSLSPLLHTSGPDVMGYEPSSLERFPMESTGNKRQEGFYPIAELDNGNENSISPASIESHGTPETTTILHPQANCQGRFACNTPGCTRSYKRYPELKRHQEIHSGVQPPHACTILRCNRRGQHGFRRKDHLRQHMKHVHGITI